MSELIKQLEQHIAELKSKLAQDIVDMYEQEMPELTEEKFALFEQTGDRITYQKDYFRRRNFMDTYGAAAIWMKQEGIKALGELTFEQVIAKLEEVILNVCAEETWALNAHVKRDIDPDWRNTIELGSSETASGMAHITKLLRGSLSRECVDTVKREVSRRVVDNFFSKPVDTCWWEHGDNNWNAVCNSNVIVAYLCCLEDGEAPKKEYLDRICDGLTAFIDGYAEDGTCLEGISYYTYGMQYFVYGALEMEKATGGKVNLLSGDWYKFKAGEVDKRTRIAEWWPICFLDGGRTISFADGYNDYKYGMGLACALALRFPSVKLPNPRLANMLETDNRFLPLYSNLFWTEEYIAYLKEQEKTEGELKAVGEAKAKVGDFRILKEAKWCVGNAANQISFACKGGHNMEPHNHNDITNFLYTVGEDVFLDDLGTGEYTKAYFEFRGRRYTILCNRSLGHNVPLIDGKEQLGGQQYCDSGFQAGMDGQKGWAKIGGETAYPEGTIQRYTRSFVFDQISGDMEIKDFFDNAGKEIVVTENLVSRYKPELCANKILFRSEKGSCRVEVFVAAADGQQDESLSGSDVQLRIVEDEFRNFSGVLEKIYLIQWDVKAADAVEVIMKVSGKLHL